MTSKFDPWANSWKPEEDAVLIRIRSEGGNVNAMRAVLPHRTKGAIHARLMRLPTARARRSKSLPGDFAQNAGSMTRNALAAHYGVSRQIVARWCGEANVKPPRERRELPIPCDFAEMAAKMHRTALRDHYDVRWRVIKRWIEVTGISPIAYSPPPPKRAKRVWNYTGPKPAEIPRDTSIEGRAADALRPYAPCYRCDEHGRQMVNGPLWRFGNVILTGDELIERASGKGWKLAA